MRVKPTTVLGQFEAAKTLSSLSGFKIFDPSRSYYRAEHQFIGATSTVIRKVVFRIWIRRGSLWIEFLPFHESPSHKSFLENEIGIVIKQRRHRTSMHRFNPLHRMVAATQRKEFDLLITDIRLP